MQLTGAPLAADVGLASAGVAWLRLDGPTRGTVWAEDGDIFLVQRHELGPWRSLFQAYAGYLHVGPRVLSDVAGVVAPIENYAVVVTALCCLTLGIVAALVFLCTQGLIASTAVRVAVAAVTVLVPAGPIETTGNLANLHWYALWLTPWLILAQPARRRHAWALGAVALLAGLTEIQVALFLPLVLFRLRDRMIRPVAAGLAVGVVAQLVATALQDRPSPVGAPPGLDDHVQGFLLAVVLPLWSSSFDGAGRLLTDHGWWGAAVLALPFVLAVVALVGLVAPVVRDRPTDRRVLAVVAVVLGAFVPFAAAIELNRYSLLDLAQFSLADLAQRPPSRYGVVPAMFLLAAALLCVDALLLRGGRWRTLAAGALGVAVVVLQLSQVAPERTWRSDGPTWRPAVEAAQEACRAGRPPAPARIAPGAVLVVGLECGPELRPVTVSEVEVSR